MADNISVANPTGPGTPDPYPVATDDDGTAHHQYVKLEFGVDNTQTKVSAANPLPVTSTALSGTVAVSSLAASLPAGTNTLGTVALVGALPAGTNFLGTVANAGTIAVSSIVAPLPAGTNTIGTMAQVGATPTGTNFIGTVANAGTVAISSLVNSLPAGTNTLGTVALVGALPAGTNFLGTVANAGTIAVSSIVSALPAGTNTVGTMAMTGTAAIVGSLPAGTNTIGTVAPVGTFTTKETRSSTGTMSHVNGALNTVVGLLNVNTNRLGASVDNYTSGTMYVGYNSSVSTVDYVVRLAPGFVLNPQNANYWEVPFNYTGTLCCRWSTVLAGDTNGGARITEYS